MDNESYLSNEIFKNGSEGAKHNAFVNPIQKCHLLEGKHFVVIHKTIMEKLKPFNAETDELYFQQEVTAEGCIILRPFKMME